MSKVRQWTDESVEGAADTVGCLVSELGNEEGNYLR